MAEETLRDEARLEAGPDDRLPVSTATGGTLPGVDLSNFASLLDIMERRG